MSYKRNYSQDKIVLSDREKKHGLTVDESLSSVISSDILSSLDSQK